MMQNYTIVIYFYTFFYSLNIHMYSVTILNVFFVSEFLNQLSLTRFIDILDFNANEIFNFKVKMFEFIN